MSKKLIRLLALLLAFTLIAAACGDDDDEATDSADSADGGGDGGSAMADAAVAALDSNGDGQVLIGVAAAGPADDGAYVQTVVDSAKALAAKYGMPAPIIVGNIQAADAATELDNLAQQDVDVIVVQASEIAEPLGDLTVKYPDIFWYCNCGAGYPDTPGLAQSLDDAGEINYSAGYATGLLLQDSDGDSVVFIGCCDLGFEKQSYLSFEAGLQAVDESFTMTYVESGAFPFDFANTANATEALNNAIADGVDAVVPFLDGAHEAVVQAANDEGLIVMSAGLSSACDRTDLDYDIAVKFDGGDYLEAVFPEMIDGTFAEGQIRRFAVGVDAEPGGIICDPTDDQQADLDAVYASIAAGDLGATLGAIAGEAYGG
jgi:basic membrane protein A and related proteins